MKGVIINGRPGETATPDLYAVLPQRYLKKRDIHKYIGAGDKDEIEKIKTASISSSE